MDLIEVVSTTVATTVTIVGPAIAGFKYLLSRVDILSEKVSELRVAVEKQNQPHPRKKRTTDREERYGPVLIVDDDHDVAEGIAESLDDHDIHAVIATSARRALAHIRNCRTTPSCILLDLMMPDMNGYEFLEQPEVQGIPIVIMTAATKVERNRIGARPVLKKPFDHGRMLEIVRSAANGKS